MVLRSAVILYFLSPLAGLPEKAPQTFPHDLWDGVLHRHVSEDGLVDYRGLQEEPEDLAAYVELLRKWSPDNAPEMFPTEADRLAYWINAYNALIIHRVVESYPVGSVRDLGGLMTSVFRKKQVVGGRELSHDDVEHGIIRKRFQEPRIHFVLNCASASCAPLQRQALTAENLEETLERAARSFLNDPRNVRFHPQENAVELSKYFDWFGEDFEKWLEKEKGAADPSVLDYLALYLDPERRAVLSQRKRWKIRFLPYDWSLNDDSRAGNGR